MAPMAHLKKKHIKTLDPEMSWSEHEVYPAKFPHRHLFLVDSSMES